MFIASTNKFAQNINYSDHDSGADISSNFKLPTDQITVYSALSRVDNIYSNALDTHNCQMSERSLNDPVYKSNKVSFKPKLYMNNKDSPIKASIPNNINSVVADQRGLKDYPIKAAISNNINSVVADQRGLNDYPIKAAISNNINSVVADQRGVKRKNKSGQNVKIKTLRSRSLFGGLLSGVFGKSPTTQNLSYVFNTTNQNSFKNSITTQTDNITNSIIEACTTTTTDITQVQGYNIQGLNIGGDLNLSITGAQSISVFDSSKFTLELVQSVMAQSATDLYSSMQDTFTSISNANLNAAVKKDTSNNALSTLANLIPTADSNSNQNISTTNNIVNSVSREFETVLKNLTESNSTISLVQNFKTDFNQQMQIYISNITTQGNANIDLSLNQTASYVKQAVSNMNLMNQMVSAVNNSQYFSVSSTLQAESVTKASTSSETKTTNSLLGPLDFGNLSASLGTPILLAALVGAVGIGGYALIKGSGTKQIKETDQPKKEKQIGLGTGDNSGLLEFNIC